ncbi:MAG: NADH-quinone oxidoreductase subunit NuoH [Desulfobacterota bacterium]|nr:NADH-quinone oxidoreductase subunit NuoH [Thermodesulfobacteriota bacterium]
MQVLYLLIEIIVKCVVVFACLMLSVAYLTWLERKVLGHLQVRYGPNRCGPFGLLQPLSDGIKAFFKEDLIPAGADKPVFVLAPMISIVSAIALFAVIPFGHEFRVPFTDWVVKLRIADIDIALLYLFGVASLGEFGIVLGGWSSGNKYGLTGSLRAAAQMISYEVALGLSITGVILLSGSLRLTEIVLQQAGGFWNWNVWYQPLAFLLYLVCGLAEINRTPFDMPESESELACGFNIEYSSMKFALFFMAEYAHMIAMAGLAVTLFWGGWQPPLPQLDFIPGVVWFCAKLFVFLFFFIWQRGTFPRLRYDQIMKFGWKVLFPLALGNLLVTALVVSLKG